MTAVDYYLRSIGACDPAVAWAEEHRGSLAELWRDCERGDWLLLFAARVGVDRRVIALAKAGCAELAIPYCRDEWTASVFEAVIEVVRRWAVGEATDDELREARDVAYDAYIGAFVCADTVRDAARAYAAYAAANTDDDDDDYATNAAGADSADDAQAEAARLAMRRRTAAAVRAAIPWDLVAAAIGGAA